MVSINKYNQFHNASQTFQPGENKSSVDDMIFSQSFKEKISEISNQRSEISASENDTSGVSERSISDLSNIKTQQQGARKPDMRQLMEAIAGRSVEDLYQDVNSDWRKVSKRASELLYGVLATQNDTRPWDEIMSSDDVLRAAREATGEMHQPVISIQYESMEKGALRHRVATINDRNGSALRVLSGSVDDVVEALNNFGVTSNSIRSAFRSTSVTAGLNEAILNAILTFKSPYEDQLSPINNS